MSSLFGGRNARASQPNIPVPEVAARITTSVQGKPRPICWGGVRIGINLISAVDFVPVLHVSGDTSGTRHGKGGVFGSGSASATQLNYSYTYQAYIIASLCEGPIEYVVSVNIGGVWQAWPTPAQAQFDLYSQAVQEMIQHGTYVARGVLDTATLFLGGQDQIPWGYMSAAHPDQALAYRGEAYIAFGPLDMGTSPSIPSMSFEVAAGHFSGNPSFPSDADATVVVADFLTNAEYGVPGFATALLGNFGEWQAYCGANGLYVSPAITDQVEASSFVSDIMQATNSAPFMSDGLLHVRPYADASLTGYGITFTVDATPIYDLDPSDFLPLQGGSGNSSSGAETRVEIDRKQPQDAINNLRLEYLQRETGFIPTIIEHRDEAFIVAFGMERISDTRSMHFFCEEAAASRSASLQLQREQILATYYFTVPPRFILLNPMDLITLPLDKFGLGQARTAVRIIEVQENDDYSLTFTAEEWLGTATMPAYERQSSEHGVPDFNAEPGGINDPIFLEPPDELGGGLFVWAGVSGLNPATWGGADIYVSTDNVSYTKVGQILGSSRMGRTLLDLPVVAKAISGVTIDSTNTLSVDLTESQGALGSGSRADMLAGNTAVFVSSPGGGEIVSYQDATLAGSFRYNLSPLQRGAYGSPIEDHPAGSEFLRLDGRIAKIPYDQSRIGQQIYVKFASFNIWGGGTQDLSEVGAHAYTITGSSLLSPLPSITTMWTAYKAGFAEIWWDEISDFRGGIRYVVKKGDSFASAILVGEVAHPPFIAFGEGDYWVTGYVTASTGALVYSESPASLTIVGNMLVDFVVISTDQQAGDWAGAKDNLSITGSHPTQTLVLGPSDLFSASDVFSEADVFALASATSSGTYEIPSSDWKDIGYIARANVNVTWNVAGVPFGSDILSTVDFLGVSDLLSSAFSANITSFIEIGISQDGSTFSAYQRFVPGMYVGRKFKLRLNVATADLRVSAVVLGMKVEITVEPRTDHYVVNATAGTNTITFKPDGAASNAPFNGGPNGATVPYWTASWSQSAGDIFVVTSLSLSQVQFQILNGGTPVARSGVNVDVQGY